MPKPELEFFDVNKIEWKPMPGYPPGVYQRLLTRDEETGNFTHMLRFDPGVQTKETLVHDFWEEVYIIKGGFIDLRDNKVYTEGMYACRPPGMRHGPYRTPIGCITIEIRYYLK